MHSVIEDRAEATTIYSREAIRLIAQFQSENPGANEHTLPIIASTEWFLNSHGRWSQSSIRVFALSLAQELEVSWSMTPSILTARKGSFSTA